jgi:hypothetical protein
MYRPTFQMKLFFLLAAVVCAGAVICSAQSRGALTIGGTVSPENSVSFALRPDYTSGELVSGANLKMLGVVTERSNHKLGYTVSLESASAQQLKHTVRYDGLPVNLMNGYALLTSARGRTPRAGCSKNLTVTSPAGLADNPSDTLTITITAN